MKKTIILDRDGVINIDSPNFIRSPDEWHPIPGSLESIVRLNQAGFQVAIATNQSGIGRGYFDLETYYKIEQKMINALDALGGHFDHIAFCPHHPDEGCRCRKPEPGLIQAVASQLNAPLTPESIWVIGDSLRDLEAAWSANCRPILVLTGNGGGTLASLPKDKPSPATYPSLSEAVEDILAK